MRLRKLLIAGAAVAAAGALTLAPAAQANNPTGDAIQEVHVGSNTSGSYATSLTLGLGLGHDERLRVPGQPGMLGW